MSIEDLKNEKHKFEKMATSGYVVIVVSFILFIPMGVTVGMGGAFFAAVFFLGGGMLVVVASNNYKKLSVRFKNAYLPEIIEKIYPGSQYFPENGFLKEDVYATKLLHKSDRYYSEDYLSGTYKNISFESADCKLQNVYHNGKTTTLVTVFLGRVYRFEFPRNFATELVLIQPGIAQKWLYGEYNRIDTESVDFNKDYLVFARDEIGAYKILLPQFMEKLMALDEKYHDKISLSFMKSTLNVAVNNNIDTMDLKMFKPIDEDFFHQFELELRDVASIIDILGKDFAS